MDLWLGPLELLFLMPILLPQLVCLKIILRDQFRISSRVQWELISHMLASDTTLMFLFFCSISYLQTYAITLYLYLLNTIRISLVICTAIKLCNLIECHTCWIISWMNIMLLQYSLYKFSRGQLSAWQAGVKTWKWISFIVVKRNTFLC